MARIIAIISLLFLTTTLFAEMLEFNELYSLYSDVITASRHKQSFLDSPSVISIIEKEELSMFRSVPQALHFLTNSEYFKFNNYNENISLYGFAKDLNDNILVLIDGEPIFQDWAGELEFDMLPVNFEDIERIEVMKSAGSSIYGSNAALGVINIITKTHYSPSIKYSLGMAHGNSGATDHYFYASDSDIHNDFSLDYSISSLLSDSSTKYGDFVWERGFFRSEGKFYPPVNDSKRLKKADFKFKKKLSSGEDFSAFLSLIRNSTYFPGLITEDNAYAGPVEKNAYLASVSYKKEYGLNQYRELNISVDHSDQSSTPLLDGNGKDVTNPNNTDSILYNKFNINFRRSILLSPIKWLTAEPILTYGMNSVFVNVDGFVYGDHSHNITTNSAFSQLELSKNRFKLNMSGRFDANSKFENKFSPRYSLSYKCNNKESLRVSFTRSYKFPNLYKAFSDYKFKVFSNGTEAYFRPNPELDPGKTVYKELSYNYLDKKNRGSITIFQRNAFGLTDQDDLTSSEAKLYNFSPAIDSMNWLWTNALVLKNSGIDFEMKHKFNNILSMTFNFIKQRTMRQRNYRYPNLFTINYGTNTFRDSMFYIPHYRANIGFHYSKDKFSSGLYYQQVSSNLYKLHGSVVDRDSFNIINLTLKYKFDPSFSLTLYVDNIADQEYRITPTQAMERRAYYLALNKNF